MYLNFYGLAEKPFNTTPDPKFLWLAPGHRDALAQLIYSVQDNRGFLVLTGEVGTGKTTLLRALLRRLDANTATAFVFNSSLPFDEILAYVLKDLGVPADGASPAQRLFALNQFLIERGHAGQRTVLIIDEAQNLDVLALEQVRLLSNFETAEDKLLLILLVGQPELQAKLQRPELRQLQQRVELHCTIPPLSRDQAREYIRARLRTAGAPDSGLFDEPATARIATYTRGIPRRMNILCDHCLVIGFAEQRRRIELDIVEQAVTYLEAPHRSGTRRSRVRRGTRRLADRVRAALVGGRTMLPHGVEPMRLLDLIRTARGLFVR